MFGTYGMAAKQMPTVAGTGFLLSTITNQYVDVAVDAQYQYIGPVHAFTARTYYIWEDPEAQCGVCSTGHAAKPTIG